MNNEKTWKTIESKNVYENYPYFEIIENRVINPNGKEGKYAFMKTKNSVAITALDKDNNICLVGQHRYIINCYTWEIPIGGFEKDEQSIEATKRELKEETGIIAKTWIYLGAVYLSIGLISDRMYFFLAKNLTERDQHTDETELLDIKWVSLSKAFEMLKNNEFMDGESTIRLYKLKQYLADNS